MSIKVIYYTAEWCLPCRKFGPALERETVARGLELVKLDVDSDPVTHPVQSVPTVVVERDGVAVDQFGALSPFQIRERLEELR